jgi:hypothetical protein
MARTSLFDGNDSEHEQVLIGKVTGVVTEMMGTLTADMDPRALYGRLREQAEIMRSQEILRELTGGKGNREIGHK